MLLPVGCQRVGNMNCSSRWSNWVSGWCQRGPVAAAPWRHFATVRPAGLSPPSAREGSSHSWVRGMARCTGGRRRTTTGARGHGQRHHQRNRREVPRSHRVVDLKDLRRANKFPRQQPTRAHWTIVVVGCVDHASRMDGDGRATSLVRARRLRTRCGGAGKVAFLGGGGGRHGLKRAVRPSPVQRAAQRDQPRRWHPWRRAERPPSSQSGHAITVTPPSVDTEQGPALLLPRQPTPGPMIVNRGGPMMVDGDSGETCPARQGVTVHGARKFDHSAGLHFLIDIASKM